MKYTINDISRISGYAKSTVSAALNNGPGVGSEARKKIQKIAEDLRYTPNELAKSISMKQYNTVGVIVRDITNPFYAKVCRAVEHYAEEYGYTTLIYNTDGRTDKIEKAIRLMQGKRVAGIILDVNGLDERIENFLKEKSVPCIVFGQNSEYADSVEADDTAGACEIAELLLSCGHGKIAYIGPDDTNFYSRRRKKGLEKVLGGKKVCLKTYAYGNNPDSIKAGYETIRALKAVDFTAVIAYNDLTAVGVIRALTERGCAIPNDVSVVSFDDVDTIVFPLTTVNIPEYEMGKRAMALLKNRLASPDAEFVHVKLPTKLVLRESVKKLN